LKTSVFKDIHIPEIKIARQTGNKKKKRKIKRQFENQAKHYTTFSSLPAAITRRKITVYERAKNRKCI
jgi:hypothetical protein